MVLLHLSYASIHQKGLDIYHSRKYMNTHLNFQRSIYNLKPHPEGQSPFPSPLTKVSLVCMTTQEVLQYIHMWHDTKTSTKKVLLENLILRTVS